MNLTQRGELIIILAASEATTRPTFQETGIRHTTGRADFVHLEKTHDKKPEHLYLVCLVEQTPEALREANMCDHMWAAVTFKIDVIELLRQKYLNQ
jgi:hypothetical protein